MVKALLHRPISEWIKAEHMSTKINKNNLSTATVMPLYHRIFLSMRDRIMNATREDGSPLFSVPVAASLLVYYVLAMQCLPTLVITRRETGSWKWAALQLGYMTCLAYLFSLVIFQSLTWMGVS